MAGVDPRASCVLIFLDGERFIDEAIRSVVGQQGCDDWELVLVDDGSTDASTAIARRWAATDPDRIRYVEHPGHANRLPCGRRQMTPVTPRAVSRSDGTMREIRYHPTAPFI